MPGADQLVVGFPFQARRGRERLDPPGRLTDYLAGDVYFKTSPSRPFHNLERARVQFGMVADMEAKDEEIQRICRG